MSYELVTTNSVGATPLLVKSGKIEVDVVHAINTAGAASYLQMFDAAAASDVTVGTTVPLIVVKSAANDPAEILLDGCVFQLGVVVASTTTALGNTGATQHVRLGVR